MVVEPPSTGLGEAVDVLKAVGPITEEEFGFGHRPHRTLCGRQGRLIGSLREARDGDINRPNYPKSVRQRQSTQANCVSKYIWRDDRNEAAVDCPLHSFIGDVRRGYLFGCLGVAEICGDGCGRPLSRRWRVVPCAIPAAVPRYGRRPYPWLLLAMPRRCRRRYRRAGCSVSRWIDAFDVAPGDSVFEVTDPSLVFVAHMGGGPSYSDASLTASNKLPTMCAGNRWWRQGFVARPGEGRGQLFFPLVQPRALGRAAPMCSSRRPSKRTRFPTGCAGANPAAAQSCFPMPLVLRWSATPTVSSACRAFPAAPRCVVN